MRNPLKISISHIILRIYLGLFSLAIILPLVWSLITSVKTNAEFFQGPFSVPSELQLHNYVRAWEEASIGRYFFNSLYISIIAVVVVLLIGSMAAYACTRLRLKIGTLIGIVFMAGLFIPTILTVATMFQQLRLLNLLDTHLGIILLYIATRIPFTVFVLTGFFITLPRELEESAHIDGCNLFRTYWNIILPLGKPGLATVAIFAFLTNWNEYVMAMTMLLSQEKATLQIGMVSLMKAMEFKVDYVALFAGLIIVMIPTLIMYMTFQKHVITGMTSGAIKG